MMITLVFADALIAPVHGSQTQVEQARRLFGRFNVASVRESSAPVDLEMPWERYLHECLNLPATSSVEAASAWFDGIDQPCWRVTPVNLHAGIDHLNLSPPDRLRLDAEQADALADSIAQTLAEHELLLERPDVSRWYLRPADGVELPWRLTASSWRVASGRNIDAYSPSDPDARAWRRMLNEIQMIWHEHPTNQARIHAGELPVNSLWLDGSPPQALSAQNVPGRDRAPDWPDRIVTDLDSLAGLAIWSGLESSDERNGLACGRSYGVPGQAQTTPRHLLMLFDPLRKTSVPDVDPVQARWNDIESRVVALRDGSNDRRPGGTIGIDLPTLPPASRIRIVLTGERKTVELSSRRSDRWKFWRSVDPRPWFEWSERDH